MVEETKENIFTHSMKSGLYIGALLIAYDFFYMKCVISSAVAMITFGGLLYFAATVYLLFCFTKKYDKEVLNGNISYLKALSYGFYVFFFGSMLYAVYTYVYLGFINQDGLVQVKDFYFGLFSQIEAVAAKNPNSIESAVALSIPDYKVILEDMVNSSTSKWALDTLWSSSFRGFFLCLFFSIFFRKKKQAH
ncbi:MAG TPA: DUF4199 domain-containing protein [Paludibacteraceae bacterium]|nr:DUF4199 domain-containing protein [Paludibacteraceae bacterium]HPH63475.1 DUF4199 domain-containing protein [Paludibacteraceae bacterium]